MRTTDEWRELLGPERPRTLPEILLHILDAADEDADEVDAAGDRSARAILNEVAGENLHKSARDILTRLHVAQQSTAALEPPRIIDVEALSPRVLAYIVEHDGDIPDEVIFAVEAEIQRREAAS